MFGIGLKNSKFPQNIGTLFRSAELFGADYVFTIGERYYRQRTDVLNSTKRLSCESWSSIKELRKKLPRKTVLVAIEMRSGAFQLPAFQHPNDACYLLGAEDDGLSLDDLEQCDLVVQIPTPRSLNVASAGTVVLYDRVAKQLRGD